MLKFHLTTGEQSTKLIYCSANKDFDFGDNRQKESDIFTSYLMICGLASAIDDWEMTNYDRPNQDRPNNYHLGIQIANNNNYTNECGLRIYQAPVKCLVHGNVVASAESTSG